MKTQMRLGSIGVVLIGCAMALACVRYVYQGPAPSRTEVTETEVAPADGSDQPFYDDLAPFGRWVYVTGPGWVWSPHSVQAGWRPYQLGHWVFTDQGWTWASDEQWGWAVYHYGRWHQDTSYGWVWVPGTEWGPAWVAWHEGSGYVGWAPLPWQVGFRASVGLDWGRVNVTIAPSSWCFVSARHLVDPVLWSHIVPTTRNVNLIQVTKNVTNYTYIDNRVVNQSVKVESIVRASGRTIPHYRVTDTDSRETARGGKVRGHDFVVFRPNPGRGHSSRGHRIPPGHDGSRDSRGDRPSAPETEPARTEGPTQANPPAQTEAPVQPAETESRPARHERPASDSDSKTRGRRPLDQLKGRPSPQRSPQKTSPSQPAPPDQESAPTAPAEAKPGTPPSGDGQSATTPPAKPAPAKNQPASRVGRGRKSADEKSRKPKQEAPKSEDSDKDKPEPEKPESGN